MLDWLACFAFNWFQQDLCLQLHIQCRRNSANMVSVEFAAKSFFPICPEIKKMDSRRLMYFGDPVEAVFQPYVLMAPPSKVLQWNKHSKTKRLDTRPKYPKRCKEKYHENLFRLSFTPDLTDCGRFTKIDSTHWRQWFSTKRNVFSGVQGAQCI